VQFCRERSALAQSRRLRFPLVQKSRLLSILAPPSFPPFQSLKTRLLYLHLLLPIVCSPLPSTLSLAHLQLVPSFLQLWYLISFCTRKQLHFLSYSTARPKEVVSRISTASDNTCTAVSHTLRINGVLEFRSFLT
jgi:hypothetical protein